MNDKGKNIEGTAIQDLLQLNEVYPKFTEQDIEDRNQLIINNFIDYLDEEGLIK